ncbi:speckle-type POZ protein A [Diachasma alloeum]|uniref:speckle-type POZ protein A n=1 Tax=Diachasma alloeum TaxID=454923 RepID=UPI0007383638|nr:speckle-type POZ protein A [Diachasma alloeum]
MSTPVPHQCSVTEVESHHFTYKWTIKDFRLLPEQNEEPVDSPNFRVTENDEVEWQLQLYPRGRSKDDSDHVSLYLFLDTVCDQETSIIVHCELSILKGKSLMFKNTFVFTYKGKIGYGFHKAVERSQLLGTSDSDDLITVYCEIDIPKRSVTKSFSPASFDLQRGQLGEQFSQLFEDTRFCDVTIIAGEKKFRAHKVVLAARSAVFSAMLEQAGTDEVPKDIVKIEDMEPAIVRGMLEFIYRDRVANLEVLARDLLMASAKYELDRLKIMCEEAIYGTLTNDTAAEIFVLSDRHRALQLKKYVMAFIDDHLLGVTQSKGYNSLAENYPGLLKELTSFIAVRRQSKI